MKPDLSSASFSSPIGELRVVVDGDGRLAAVDFPRQSARLDAHPDATRCAAALRQLREYFAGVRREFDLELAPTGTPFQRRVWDELRWIPFGGTISYKELARRIGQPAAVRAVGRANGDNPVPIVVPCHRVIGADGSLTGFGGGLAIKRALLRLEGVEVDQRDACVH